MKKVLLVLALTLAVFGLSSCGLTVESDDIINPEADYVYFFGKTCPHCQELNAWMESDNTHSKHAIEKREVYFNADNGVAFQAVTKALGLEEGSSGVPFMLDKSTNKHYIGVEPIKALLTAKENGTTPEAEALESATPVEEPAIETEVVEVVEEAVAQ